MKQYTSNFGVKLEPPQGGTEINCYDRSLIDTIYKINDLNV
jgi:hypothetical protein